MAESAAKMELITAPICIASVIPGPHQPAAAVGCVVGGAVAAALAASTLELPVHTSASDSPFNRQTAPTQGLQGAARRPSSVIIGDE